MKKLLLFFFISVLLSSCISLPDYKPTYYSSSLDYSPLLERGIYVSKSLSVPFDYIALSNVVVTGVYGIKDNRIVEPELNSVYEKLIEELESYKANGIIGLDITSKEVPEISRFSNESQYKVGQITITGMAIKTDKRKLPILTSSSLKNKIPSKDITSCVIDSIVCNIVDNRSTGVIILTNKELNNKQISKSLIKFNLSNKQSMFFLPNSKKAYAGTTENGYIINYNTNEFQKIE